MKPFMFCLAWLLLIAGNALTVLGYETGKAVWYLAAFVADALAIKAYLEFDYLQRCARQDAINKGALNATGRATESRPEDSTVK